MSAGVQQIQRGAVRERDPEFRARTSAGRDPLQLHLKIVQSLAGFRREEHRLAAGIGRAALHRQQPFAIRHGVALIEHVQNRLARRAELGQKLVGHAKLIGARLVRRVAYVDNHVGERRLLERRRNALIR